MPIAESAGGESNLSERAKILVPCWSARQILYLCLAKSVSGDGMAVLYGKEMVVKGRELKMGTSHWYGLKRLWHAWRIPDQQPPEMNNPLNLVEELYRTPILA